MRLLLLAALLLSFNTWGGTSTQGKALKGACFFEFWGFFSLKISEDHGRLQMFTKDGSLFDSFELQTSEHFLGTFRKKNFYSSNDGSGKRTLQLTLPLEIAETAKTVVLGGVGKLRTMDIPVGARCEYAFK